MEIKSTITTKSNQTFNVTYHDIESDIEIKDKKIVGVHAFCFYQNNLVIVYAAGKGYWGPPGGSVEEGETAEEAVIREIKEESNMKVLKHKFIGYQEIIGATETIFQTRSVCIVEPYGDFLSDPDDGEITEIKLINPKDYKKYFDWDKIGEHIVKRALELKDTL